MAQGILFLLSLALGVLWLAELGVVNAILQSGGQPGAIAAVTWIDLAIAVVALALSFLLPRDVSKRARVGWISALAGALCVLGVASLKSDVGTWMSYWNFAFAAAFLLVAVGVSWIESMPRATLTAGDYFGNRYHPYRRSAPGYHLGMMPYTDGEGVIEEGAPVGEHYGKGPRGYRRSDVRIAEDINDRLAGHPQIDATDVVVMVTDGEVTLTGTVTDRRARRLAEAIADSVLGVTDVHNELVPQETLSTTRYEGAPPQIPRRVS